MLYWIITLSFVLIGTVIAWKTLTNRWNEYDPITLSALPILRAGRNMPGDYNYLDLKFSIARHAVAFLITAAIMFWLPSSVITNVFFFGYGFYTVSVVVRYTNRKGIIKDLNKTEEEKALAEMLSKPLKDSRVVMIYSLCAELAVLVLYVIRP